MLRVRLLGDFVVEGFDERSLGSRKARLLLKRLAVALGRPVAADALAEAVWGDGLPSKPNDQLSVLVSRLRSVLGPDRLPRTDAGYRLAADWFDLTELAARCDEVEARLGAGERSSALAAGRAALGLAAGPLLPEEDGEWVDEARPAAARTVARARLLAARAALAVGEYAAARAAAQSSLDHDPYDEAALRLAMEADVLAGRPGVALAAYAEVRHRLADDLGADPAPETEALHTAILRGEMAAAAAPDAVALVGRSAELDRLDALLQRASDGRSLAAVVEAGAGLGKTALLSAWTNRLGPRPSAPLVLAGRCDELGRDLPLQPVIDGLAAHLESLGRVGAAELVGADASWLDPLLGLGLSLGSGPAGGPAPAAGPVLGVTAVADTEGGRATLFAGLAGVLGRAAGDRSLVLVVDDLHQAAPGTAGFLAFALRRVPRLLVVAGRRSGPGPDLPGAARLALAPLTVQDAAALVGAERAEALHERSGGHPLFLRELAASAPSPGDELPGSIVASVRAQVARLGTAAATVEAAACCGADVDAELVAAVTARPVPAVLDDLEAAAGVGLLRPSGAVLRFSHALVREAVEAGTSPVRRAAVHRAAVVALAGRRVTDPLTLARHARLGGDPAVAAAALVSAAAQAAGWFESAAAEAMLDEAVRLDDSAAARLARGRVRLGRLEVDGAGDDAMTALDLGAGVDGFELAGWVAYYGRDYDTARRYADEGVERAASDELRSSCLALSGRIRHTRGELGEASQRLAAGAAIAPPGIRGMVQVWQAQLLAHQGAPVDAIDLARRGLLDPHLAHPFAAGHGRFTLAYAQALTGQWADSLATLDELDRYVARGGDRRFPPSAANLRGFLLRGAGLLAAAQDQHAAAVDLSPGPNFLEAHYAALLDRCECLLALGDISAAGGALADAHPVVDWAGSMAWRQQQRYELLRIVLASAGGAHHDAADGARAVSAAAAARGDRRYRWRALVVAATSDARSGRAWSVGELGDLVEAFVPISGPDGWRDLAHLAAATGRDELWRAAEEQAAALVTDASGSPRVDAGEVATAVRHQLDALRP